MPFEPGKSGNPTGRPRKADVHAAPIADFYERVAQHLPELFDLQLALARGVTIQEIDGDGGTNIYTKPPDQKAGAFLIEHVVGKATQRQELTGPDGDAMEVHITDDERSRRLAAILDRARARRAGQPADDSQPEELPW